MLCGLVSISLAQGWGGFVCSSSVSTQNPRKATVVLLGVKAQKPRGVPVPDRHLRHHLGIENRAGREGPVEDPGMPVRPVHHGCHGEQFAARHGRWRGVGHIAVLERTVLKLNWKRQEIQSILSDSYIKPN